MSIKGVVRMMVPAGAAKPSPAVGQALGPLGVNMMEFCKSFNAHTDHLVPEVPTPVVLTAMQDRSFTFICKSPPTSWLIKRCAGIEKGANQPGSEIAGRITTKHVYEIAKVKQADAHLAHIPLQSLCKTVMASCRSMGVEVVNK